MFRADLGELSESEEVDQVSSQNPESTTGSFARSLSRSRAEYNSAASKGDRVRKSKDSKLQVISKENEGNAKK